MKKIIALLLAATLMLALPIQCLGEEASEAAPASGFSLSTGLPTTQEYKPMVVQLDNEPNARPQKGIASADVVYEIEIYNGGYTRYTAVFNDTIPHLVEAIRSARICNVDLYFDWRGGFVHYGGQSYDGTNVFNYIDQMKPDAVWDGMKYSNFKRDSSRKAPNNVYTYLDEVMATKEFTVEARSPMQFSADNPTVKGEDAANFEIVYRSKSYRPSYSYNAEEGVYYRSYNDEQQVDGDTGENITCANVIVMRAKAAWSNGMSDAPIVTLTGSNACEYFIGGKHFTGTWTRNSVRECTQYFDDEGNIVNFMPGKTFIQIAKDSVEVNVL